ncbi:YkgJ family cysteine cluster protein [Pectobacterium aroidearum]|uniref:YkgJ family cysteine cluster protein n=1 Tax=Pectobacterium aroidearum TaxID=1201031 RepID=UPI0015F0DCDB|nr:YkgJ family cysteine cluster protein [Pectobacterium aroidearum]MBA5236933.1 YkgJ family cysteine cluster protein [Pectobacterium aroidearum]
MKLVNDSECIKAKLKEYSPKLSGKRLKPIANHNNDKIDILKNIFSSETTSTNDKTQAILDLSDEFRNQDNVSKHAVCQNGCAYCCKIPVSVTALEAILIGSIINKRPKELNEIKRSTEKDCYCPFLDQKKANCSIYKVRPLHCRNFHSLDHYKYCNQINKTHLIFTTASSDRLKALEEILIQGSQGRIEDIRDWF